MSPAQLLRRCSSSEAGIFQTTKTLAPFRLGDNFIPRSSLLSLSRFPFPGVGGDAATVGCSSYTFSLHNQTPSLSISLLQVPSTPGAAVDLPPRAAVAVVQPPVPWEGCRGFGVSRSRPELLLLLPGRPFVTVGQSDERLEIQFSFLRGHKEESAKLWDTRTLQLIKTYATERPVNAVAMSPLLDHELKPPSRFVNCCC